MKNFFILTLLCSSLVFSQDKLTEPTPNTETAPSLSKEFDGRCMVPLQWSAQIITARNHGTTKEQIFDEMERDYRNGSLTDKETIVYMLNVVEIVYSMESVETDEQIFETFNIVESVCLDFIDSHTKSRKKHTLFT